MNSRGRPRVTLKVLFFAVLDGAGIIVFASGAMWLVRSQTLFIPDFPTSTPTAVLTVVAGISLMLWATAQMLRELIKAAQNGGADES
ncbi:MAG: hypothetical protein H6942_01025 [Candidatus Accumulibacter sp.]|uniref:hypothetical protein n=1 Tax=Accumulibacter sp. TaxID=2053492 RepID=UPI0019EAA6D8|nr:hypothetical protein [Accumulibacter sp.]MBE2258274.1 hypothetical protein [Paracoccaceae bacterium]MCB1942762.1 hypothetical protein [Accumulibacter sp.]MCP5247117.1 hypothetical protein [Accumulibacter sp.]